MSRPARVAALLPPRRTRLLAAVQLIDALGTGAFLSASTVLYVRGFGFATSSIALAVGLAGAAGAVATVTAGRVVDRAGHRRSLAVLTAVQAGTYPCFLAVHGIIAFAALLAVIAFVDYAKGTAYSAVLADHLEGDADAVRIRARLRAYFNAGFFGGAGLAAVLLTLPAGALLPVFVAANAVSYLICCLLVLRLPAAPMDVARGRRRRFGPLREPAFLGSVLLTSLLGLHGVVLVTAMPVWLLTRTDVPRPLVPVLLVLNTVLAITLQVAFSRGADGVRGSARAGRQSSWLLATGCLLLAAAGAGPVAWSAACTVLAVIAVSLAELRQAAGRWGLSFALAPTRARAEHLGAFNLSLALTAVYGAPLALGLVDRLGAAGWAVLAVVVVAAGIALAPVAAAAERRVHEIPDTAGALVAA